MHTSSHHSNHPCFLGPKVLLSFQAGCHLGGPGLLSTTNKQTRLVFGLSNSLKCMLPLGVDITEARLYHQKLFRLFNLQWTQWNMLNVKLL
uniref:Copper amine oxidase, putative n=1 Tax=Arundo donax TaxID=35708 RepID=A0A0A9CV71_ARUDO